MYFDYNLWARQYDSTWHVLATNITIKTIYTLFYIPTELIYLTLNVLVADLSEIHLILYPKLLRILFKNKFWKSTVWPWFELLFIFKHTLLLIMIIAYSFYYTNRFIKIIFGYYKNPRESRDAEFLSVWRWTTRFNIKLV